MGPCMGVNHSMARFYPKPSLAVLGVQTESEACHGLCLHGLAPVTYPPCSPFAFSRLTTLLAVSFVIAPS